MLQELTDADFDREVIDSGLRWAVLFSSKWCGGCAAMTPRVEALAAARPDLRFGKADIGSCPRTAAALGVLSIPAVILFREGKEAARLAGAVSADELERAMERLG